MKPTVESLRGLLVGALLVGVVAFVAWSIQAQANDQLYRNSIANCVRGNALREVVWRNTTNAVVQSEQAHDPPSLTQPYRDNLKILASVDGFNPKDGTVHCRAVLAKP